MSVCYRDTSLETAAFPKQRQTPMEEGLAKFISDNRYKRYKKIVCASHSRKINQEIYNF